MQKIKNILKKHYIAVIIAVLVGVVSIAPHIFFLFDDSYAGIQMFGADAEDHYVSRIREVYDGNPSLGNVFLPDKKQPYLTPGLGEIIVAYFGKALFMNAVKINVFSKFIFPAIIFLLIYFFAYRLFFSKTISILSSAAAFFGYNLFSEPNSILGLFSFATSQSEFLVYTRPINPEVSSIFLFASLYLLLGIICGRISLWRIILLGTLSGLSVYISIYPWSFLLLSLGLYFLYFIYKREFDGAKHIIYAIIINIATTAPFWLNFISLKSNEFYLDTAIRQGLTNSHTAVWSSWLFILFAILIFFWPEAYRKAKIFLLISVASLIAATNQNIITGVYIQPSHYHWYITKPFVAIIITALFVYLIYKFIKNKIVAKVILLFAAAVLFYNGALIQINSYARHLPSTIEKQHYAPVIKYLNDNFQTTQTVWANVGISELIPMYTKHNSPNNTYAGLYLSGERYYIDRLLLHYKLRGIKPEDIYEIMQDEKADVSQRVYIIRHREELGSYDAIPDEVIASFSEEYSRFYNRDIEDIFNDFNVDMIIWDKKEWPGFPYKSLEKFKEIKNIGDKFIVYTVL